MTCTSRMTLIINSIIINIHAIVNVINSRANGYYSMRFPTTFFMFLAVTLSQATHAAQCPGTAKTITGTVYCDNAFTLWVNGQKVATDPIDFTPHQAVQFAFGWDGISNITYAIQCEDFASDSGYEYIGSGRPKLGDGALIATFDDGLGTRNGLHRCPGGLGKTSHLV